MQAVVVATVTGGYGRWQGRRSERPGLSYGSRVGDREARLTRARDCWRGKKLK